MAVVKASTLLNAFNGGICGYQFLLQPQPAILTGCSYCLTHKRFWYYRFQKKVGKGKWNGYIERYQRPSSVENKQPLIYNYLPHYLDAKETSKWMWLLPKEVAKHTKPNGLLDCWVYYRSKRKLSHHYLKVLERLVAVGGCDITDWRFKLISRRIQKLSKKFKDLPLVCYYFSILKASSDVEGLTRFLVARIHLYTPKQLSQIAESFQNCYIQDTFLFSRIAKFIRLNIDKTTNEELATTVKAFATTMTHDYPFLSFVSNEIQSRMLNASSASTTAKAQSVPSLGTLSIIAEAFAVLKYQEFQFFNRLSLQVQQILRSQNTSDPFCIAQIVDSFHRAKINDIPLLECVLLHVDQYIFDYPPKCVSIIGVCTALQLPPGLPSVKQVMESFRLSSVVSSIAIVLTGSNL